MKHLKFFWSNYLRCSTINGNRRTDGSPTSAGDAIPKVDQNIFLSDKENSNDSSKSDITTSVQGFELTPMQKKIEKRTHFQLGEFKTSESSISIQNENGLQRY
jgi:hypothetical protein